MFQYKTAGEGIIKVLVYRASTAVGPDVFKTRKVAIEMYLMTNLVITNQR